MSGIVIYTNLITVCPLSILDKLQPVSTGKVVEADSNLLKRVLTGIVFGRALFDRKKFDRDLDPNHHLKID